MEGLLALMRNRLEGEEKCVKEWVAYARVDFVLLSKRFHGIDNKSFEWAVIIEKKTRQKEKRGRAMDAYAGVNLVISSMVTL